MNSFDAPVYCRLSRLFPRPALDRPASPSRPVPGKPSPGPVSRPGAVRTFFTTSQRVGSSAPQALPAASQTRKACAYTRLCLFTRPCLFGLPVKAARAFRAAFVSGWSAPSVCHRHPKCAQGVSSLLA